MTKKVVKLEQIKLFALQELPLDWVLRKILLSENDEVEIADFLSRLPIYLRLSRLGGANHKC